MTDTALSAALRDLPGFDPQPSAAERVAAALRLQIVDGALHSGTRLTEETISAALGVSRNTIREAFALLVAERIVVREPNRGVFVATPTADDVRDLYRTRLAIEPAALEHGLAFDAEHVAALRAAVSQGERAHAADDLDGVAQANQRFHRGIIAMTGSERLAQLMDGVLAEMRLVFHLMGGEPGFHMPYLARNAEIVTLLESGDRAGAAEALRTYLLDAQGHLLATLTGGQSLRS